MGTDILNKAGPSAYSTLIVAAALSIMISLAACQSGATVSTPLPSDVPENALHVKGDLYMIPIKKDKSGCMMYRAYSTTGSAVAAIFYRAAEGGFVMSKAKSACP